VICSTNAIESLNTRYRRAIRGRGRIHRRSDAPDPTPRQIQAT
jgi:transposase-like protein